MDKVALEAFLVQESAKNQSLVGAYRNFLRHLAPAAAIGLAQVQLMAIDRFPRNATP
jgi:hypothetical protein